MMKQNKKTTLARNALHQAIKDFHHPNIPEPVITNARRKNPLMVDEKNWQIELSVHDGPNLSEKDLIRYYRCLWRIGISYYLVCPYDMKTSVEITTSAISGSNRKVGETIANLFIELIVEYFLARTFPDDTFWFWNRKREFLEVYSPKEKIHKVFTLVLEVLLEQKILPRKFHKKLSENEKQLAEDIATIIRREGVLRRQTWPKKVKKMAKLISKSLRKEKKIEEVRHLFPREMRGNSIIKAFIRSGGKFTEAKKDKIAEIVYKKTSGEPYASAASLYSTISPDSPKEAARYWYRSRSANIMELKLEKKEKKEKIKYQALPEDWRLGDPVEELDVLLSLSSFPLLIPNLTTKKWKEKEKTTKEGSSFPPNMLVVIDSSNSMYYPPEGSFASFQERRENEKKMEQFNINYPYKSKLDMSIVASFAAVGSAMNRNCSVAAINFSGDYELVGWTKNREAVEDVLLKFRGDGTEFPVGAFENLVGEAKTKTVIVIITDSAIYNKEETAQALSKTAEGNHLYLFKIGESEKGQVIIEKVRAAGGEIINLHDLNKLVQLVGERTKSYYAL